MDTKSRFARGIASIAGILLISSALPGVAAAQDQWIIVDDTVLSADRVGGIIIAADDVVLDCAGHTIRGDGSIVGVNVRFVSRAVVRNCLITGFEVGLQFEAVADGSIRSNRLEGNGTGI